MRISLFLKYNYLTFLLLLCLTTGCKKYLDEKPRKNLTVPSTLKDLQALLDQNNTMNIGQANVSDAGTDDYYLTMEDWNSLENDGDRNSYIWGDELFYNSPNNQWQILYKQVYTANVVLEFVDKVQPGEDMVTRNKIKAAALFLRARAHFTVLMTWAKAYSSNSASNDPGIPLRLLSDFNIPSKRSSIEQCYDQILTDLTTSISIFPVVKEHVMRPSKAAAWALIARVYLNKADYVNSLKAAEESLKLNDNLMDFNTIDPSSTYPIPRFNSEILFSCSGGWRTLYNFTAKIDTVLFRMYEDNDLRKSLFYATNENGTKAFRGSYDGSFDFFLGLATDEIYLIKAECQVRLGNIESGLQTLNQLLVKRYKSGTYINKSGLDKVVALQTIINERRKELLMRDIRWQDIKRLNIDNSLQPITIKRIIGTNTYELKPNDPRYALPIPTVVISLTGISQNPR